MGRERKFACWACAVLYLMLENSAVADGLGPPSLCRRTLPHFCPKFLLTLTHNLLKAHQIPSLQLSVPVPGLPFHLQVGLIFQECVSQQPHPDASTKLCTLSWRSPTSAWSQVQFKEEAAPFSVIQAQVWCPGFVLQMCLLLPLSLLWMTMLLCWWTATYQTHQVPPLNYQLLQKSQKQGKKILPLPSCSGE